MTDDKTEKSNSKDKEKIVLLERMIVQAKPAGPEPATPQSKKSKDKQSKAKSRGD